MKKRATRQIVIRILIATAVLIVLIIAGTILRMKTDNIAFFDAMGIFLRNTFTGAGRK